MKLPKQYEWLAKEGASKMLVEALKHYGLLEIPGPKHNASLMAWSKELGLDRVYTSDEIAWCGLFMAILAKRAGKALPFTYTEALWALNWKNYSVKVDVPMLGDVLVFRRPGNKGHVGLYVGEDKDCYHVLGGNQGNKVSILRIAKTRLHAARRLYNIQPENVRIVFLDPSGEISENEG